MSNIMCATDFSHRATAALNKAAFIAKKSNLDLSIVHAVNLKFFERLLVGKRRIELKNDLKKQLEDELTSLDLKGEAIAEIGLPSDVILDTARILSPSLLVLGDHGEFHLKDTLLGTTARHIIEHAHMPLLVVKSTSEIPYKTVLLATDFSDSSKRAIELAIKLFPESDFVLFSAFLAPNTTTSNRYKIKTDEIEALVSEMTHENQKELERFKETLEGAPKSLKLVSKPSASITNAILEATEETKAELLVMGTKGIGSIMPMMVGSVTDSLLRHSKIDMLVFKA